MWSTLRSYLRSSKYGAALLVFFARLDELAGTALGLKQEGSTSRLHALSARYLDGGRTP